MLSVCFIIIKKAQKPKENNMLPMRPIARRDQRHKQTVKLTD